jgi:hypothetical protein
VTSVRRYVSRFVVSTAFVAPKDNISKLVGSKDALRENRGAITTSKVILALSALDGGAWAIGYEYGTRIRCGLLN